MKKFLSLILLISYPFIAGSHIGNPGVTFEGNAGPYNLLVLITPPDVIPGTATIHVYTERSGIQSISTKPVYWFAGDEGTPESDVLVQVPEEPGHYSGQIWLMSSGTSGIQIDVTGESGQGNVLVPVMAVSTAQKELPAHLGWILLALAILLVVLMVTIIAASVSDGLVKSTDAVVAAMRKKRIRATIISTLIILLILWGGKSWWDGLSNSYKRFMYKPYVADSRIEQNGNRTTLIFNIKSENFRNLRNTRNLNYIIPDHGKLMHLFLMRAGSMDVFAHLHPQRKDSVTFISPLPSLPSGKYLLFADITRLSGFSETIPDTLEIKEAEIPSTFVTFDSVQTDRDDTYFITNPVSASTASVQKADNIIICGKPGSSMELEGGTIIAWKQDPSEPLISGKLYSLKFTISEGGVPVALEPYLGMMGHAVVMKTDGSTYVHLHPTGSYSTASQETMLTRFEKETGPVKWDKLQDKNTFRDSIDQVVATLKALSATNMSHSMAAMVDGQLNPENATVSFPYAFPSPGRYRIWVQMKRHGRILNSAFDTSVE